MATPRKPDYRSLANRNLSLVQQNDAQRALVAKMRNRLAGGSEFMLQVEQTKRRAVRKSAFGWGTKIGAAAIVILANLTYLGYHHEENIKAAPPKHAPVLPAPKAGLSKEDRALYWAYALYDFDRLKSRFGVSAATVIDAPLATAKLNELLPKIDARTRVIIEGYLPPARRTL